ncbi:hypothetical protein M501DRAFT_988792 [Patellaria atrata CBS 101060]|uniref:Uncharacterized protein n=1 Tax=Patellaria atrata CBS 101060 TaxID=1346257 RepID=A0A9P4S585_9PEZI|nr:hypothetical protein M501DRAFT_988792 [Patellaria atrata CBS 101060]
MFPHSQRFDPGRIPKFAAWPLPPYNPIFPANYRLKANPDVLGPYADLVYDENCARIRARFAGTNPMRGYNEPWLPNLYLTRDTYIGLRILEQFQEEARRDEEESEKIERSRRMMKNYEEEVIDCAQFLLHWALRIYLVVITAVTICKVPWWFYLVYGTLFLLVASVPPAIGLYRNFRISDDTKRYVRYHYTHENAGLAQAFLKKASRTGNVLDECSRWKLAGVLNGRGSLRVSISVVHYHRLSSSFDEITLSPSYSRHIVYPTGIIHHHHQWRNWKGKSFMDSRQRERKKINCLSVCRFQELEKE